MIDLFTDLTGKYQLLLLANTGYTASSTSAAIAQLGLWKSVKVVTAALWEQTKAFLATPIGIISAAAIAIFGLVKVTTWLSESTERAKEQFQEISDTISQNTTEIDRLNDEMQTTQERIDELESMGNLSFTDASELKQLKAENAERERKIRLLERENKEKSKEAVKTFKKSYNGFDTEYNWSRTTTDVDNNGNLTAGYITEADYIRETIGLYHELIELEKDVNYKGYTTANGRANGIEENITSEELKKELDGYLKLATEYHDAIDKLYESGYVYGSDAEVDKTIDSMYEIIDLYEASQGETTGLFDSIINRDKYAEARSEIEKLAEAGNLTAASLSQLYNENDDVKEFYDYISEVFGYDTSNIDEQTAAIKKQADAYNALVNGNVDYNKRPLISPEKMKVVYPDFDGEVATTYDMDFGLSSKTTGEILYTVKVTPILEDGTILDQQSLDKYIYEELQPIVDNGGSTEDLLAYDKAHKNILINVDVGETKRDSEGLTDLDKKLGEIKNGHWEATKQLNDNSGFENFANELNKVVEAAKGATSAIKSFTDIADSFQDGYDAIIAAQKDVEEQNYLSADSVKALEKAGLTDYLKETEYGYLLVNDALNTYLEAQGKEYKNALDEAISQASSLATMQDAVAAGYKNDAAGLATYLRVLGAANNAMARNQFKDNLISKGFTVTEAHRMWMSSQQRVAADQAQSEYIAAANAIDAAIKNQKTYEMVRKTVQNDAKYSSGNKSSTDKNDEAEKQINDLKHQHEMGLISEATYYKNLEAIRQEYYAGNKDYLERDRELQEEYHDWEVKNAEDGFEDKIKSLQEQYANGKITYAKLQSELKGLINSTFKNDIDTKNKYLEELSDYLEEAEELKDKKNKEDFESSYDKLKYQLENGFISEATYYKKLDELYKKHYSNKTKYLDEYSQYSQEVYDGFKDMYKEDLEADKKALEEKKEAVTEYYDDLIEKIQDTHDEEDYEKEQSEKRKEIFDLDMQIAELMRDGSEKAKARIAELEEERLKAEEDLLDFETDKAREDEIERLEKEKEKREKEVQDEIDHIDETLDSLNDNTKDIRDIIIQYAKSKGVDINFAYASGTRSSVGGFGRINEKGIEMISAPDGNGNYVNLMPGSYVFSAKATEFLWKLATEHSLPQAMYNSIAKSIKTQSSTPSVNIAQPINITMGDVIIQGNADKQTVADIKRQQENTVRMVLEKIKELQK